MKKIKFKFTISIVLLVSSALSIFFFEETLVHYRRQIYTILFVYFLIDSLEVILPVLNKSIYSSKMSKRMYIDRENYNKTQLRTDVLKNNKRALIIFLIYTIAILIVGFSYLHFEWFTESYMYLIFFAINFGDYFCILVWCPFRKIFLKNTCCNTCRISNWDRWMKVSILLFIPNIFTISINIIAFSIFIYWEYNHLTYPERFYRVSNKRLLCSYCDKDKCNKWVNKKDCSK